MLNINRLNKRITIKDADNIVVRTCFASVSNMTGTEVVKNNVHFEQATTRFIIRYTTIPITSDMYIVFDGFRYDIQYTNNYNFANESIEIIAIKRSYLIAGD